MKIGGVTINHVGTKQIETSRIILRRYKMDDAGDMYANWVTDPAVSRFWSWKPHKDIEETKELLATWIEEYANLNKYHWVIVLKDISQAIGYVYFTDIDDINGSLSVHYALSRKYWNQGIMTEACKCALTFAFDVLDVKRIHSAHHIDNTASSSVLKKVGMKYIETKYKDMPDCENLSGEYLYYEMRA